MPVAKHPAGSSAHLYTLAIDCLEYQTEYFSRKFAGTLAKCHKAFTTAKQGNFQKADMDQFEEVYNDLYYTNEYLKYELLKSPVYEYLKLKANGDKAALAPWESKPIPKAKTSLRKRKRPSAINEADDSSATEPSIDSIREQLAHLQSNGVNLSCLANLLQEPPAPEITSHLLPAP